MEINQKEIENKWQKIWEDKKVFETNLDEKKEKFFGTVAYPYANSILHIGHGRTFTSAEIFLRYQRLLGKNVLFPMGFHISGTPVLAVADAIKKGEEKQIKITKDAISEYLDDEGEIDATLKTFKEAENIAKFFSQTIEDSFKKIGIGIDWRRKFSTGDKLYNKFIEWQYKKLNNLGILTKGKYPILYSVEDENAVGEDDIKDGDTDKVSILEMTYILFEDKDEKNLFFAVATLRPDALFGTSNLWIKEDMKLVKINIGIQKWIISKDSYNKIKYQFDNVSLISEHLGKEFIGKNVISPIINREVIIAKANFLDSFQGTGIVYSSPAGSPHDFLALKQAISENRISPETKIINTVEIKDKKGNLIIYKGSCPAEDKCLKFNIKSIDDEENIEKAKQELYKEEHYGGKLNENANEFAGLYIKDAKDKIKAKLIELNLGGDLLETSRVAKTRNGDRVIVANLEGQWFLDYTNEDIKKKAYELLESMDYFPKKFKETQKFYLEWLTKRPCARKRGLGTKLPFDEEWIIEPLSDSTIYQLLYEISHIINRENINPENLKEELFDFLYLNIGNLKDVSKITNIQIDIVEEMKKEVDYWQNTDFRYVGQPHMSNHMSFLIYHYAIIFNKEELKKFHPKIALVGGMLQRNGEKISKSKGNGIPLSKIGKEFGADLYRLYIALAASFDASMDFKDEEIAQLEKKFDKFKELMFSSKNIEKISYENFNDLDKFLISKFYSNAKLYFENMEKIKIREAYVAILYDNLSAISYHSRRSSYEDTLKVIRFFFNDFLKLMCPAIPHICEELYLNEDNENLISLASFNTNCDDYINKNIENIENIVEDLISNIARVKDNKNLNEIKIIKIIQASNQRFLLFDELKKLLDETKEFKKIVPKLLENFKEESKFIQKFVPKTLSDGLDIYLSKIEEKNLLEKIIPFIENEFNTKVEIISNEDSINNLNAIPRKPSIILE